MERIETNPRYLTDMIGSAQDPVTLGELRGDLKSWKTLRLEWLGWNLMGQIRRSPRYMIYITGMDPLCFGELGGGLILKN